MFNIAVRHNVKHSAKLVYYGFKSKLNLLPTFSVDYNFFCIYFCLSVAHSNNVCNLAASNN